MRRGCQVCLRAARALPVLRESVVTKFTQAGGQCAAAVTEVARV